jgi:hypothetical protein
MTGMSDDMKWRTLMLSTFYALATDGCCYDRRTEQPRASRM